MSSSPALVREDLERQSGIPFSLSPEFRTALACLALIVAVFVCYGTAARNGFIKYLDDDLYITGNFHVRAGLTWATVKWAFTTYDISNWHPLTWISHALDCQLFGLKPYGHHFMNVLMHALNAALLYLLLQRSTGFRWRSLAVAALFALHPINVESVAWVAERKNVLSMLFFLLALNGYVWYVRRPGIVRYAAIAFPFALALLSKPQVITFPLLLLLWDYWPLRRIGTDESAAGQSHAHRSWGWLILEKVPLLLLSAASALVTMKAQKVGGALRTLSDYSFALRLETALASYVGYLGKAIWPSKLVVLYPHPTKLYPLWQVAACVLLLAVITVLIFRAREQRYLAVGWLWFVGTLVPMIGLVQVGVQGMADRYTYIPFVGLFVMVTWFAADLAQARQVQGKWLAIAALPALLILGILTYRQVGYWHDTESVWLRTLALTQDNYVAHDTLGSILLERGQTEEAAAHFRASLAIRPDDLPATEGLGTYEHGRGNLQGAIRLYQKVGTYAADKGLRAMAYGNLGSAYRQIGEFGQAKQYFDAALQLAPDQTLSMVGLGLIAQRNGDLPEAVRQYSHAMAVQPTDVGFLLLAKALQEEGHTDEANAIYERVSRLSPNLPEAQKSVESLLSGR